MKAESIILIHIVAEKKTVKPQEVIIYFSCFVQRSHTQSAYRERER